MKAFHVHSPTWLQTPGSYLQQATLTHSSVNHNYNKQHSGTVSYLPSTVTMAVSLAISDIFNVKEWSDLEIWVWNRSRSLKMAQFDRPCATFYWSAIVTIALSCTICELFDVEYYRDLEIWLRGHSISFKLVPFESLGVVSHSPSIVTMAVSVAVCEIFSVKEWHDLENQVRGRSRSLKMAPFDRLCDFLLVGHCKYSSILYRLQDMVTYW